MMRKIRYIITFISLFISMTSFSQQISKELMDRAQNGDSKAQYVVAEIYYYDYNDYPKAALWWQKASDNGNTDATYNLSVLYKLGYGVPKDMAKSVSLLKIAAEKGCVSAMYNLSNYYQRGDGVPQDWSQCYYWRKKAADNGSGGACFNLARDYGVGTPALQQNTEQAIAYLNKAAEIGYPYSLIMLGMACYEGAGYANWKKDYPKAVRLLNEFIDKSKGEEMENEFMGTAYLTLSKCYRFGRGVAANEAKANEYYNKAQAYGVTNENIDNVIKELQEF